MNHTTVQNIVEAAGGYVELSYELGLTNFAVRSWYRRGIPRRYWKLLTSRTGLTVDDIEGANRRAVQSANKKAREQ